LNQPKRLVGVTAFHIAAEMVGVKFLWKSNGNIVHVWFRFTRDRQKVLTKTNDSSLFTNSFSLHC